MISRHRGSWTLVAALIVVAMLSGCGGTKNVASTNDSPKAALSSQSYLAQAGTTGRVGGTLNMQVVADIDEPSGLDPQLSNDATSWQLESLVYNTLVGMSPKLKPTPELASSWDVPNPRTYVFHLRPNAAFSNGRRVNAGDVVGSLDRLLNPAVGAFWRAQLGPITSVAKVNDETVKITLSRPYTPLLAALANINAAILPIKEIDAHEIDISKTMLGTGPYMVKAHIENVSWTLVKNPHYWGAPEPWFNTIHITISPQEATRIAAIRDGSAGIASMTNVDTPRILQAVPDVKVGVQHTTDYWYLLMNAEWPGSKLRNQRVRDAIDIAINRQQISTIAQAGLGIPTADSPVAFGACDPAKLPSATAGLQHAKQLLQEAHATHLTFSLMTYNTDPQVVAIAQVIQQQLRRIGVTVVIKNLDPGVYSDNVDSHHYDALLSYFAGYGNPAMVLQWWKPGVLDYTEGVIPNDPRLNSLIDSALQATGSQVDPALQAVCDRADEDASIVALTTRPAIIAWRTNEVQPTIYANEGYDDIWRGIASYRGGS